MIRLLIMMSISFIMFSCGNSDQKSSSVADADTLRFAREQHLKNIRMLTFEGENAEAYFSFDEKRLIFQSAHGEYKCDQIFTMNIDGSGKSLVSTGKGRTTCSYFLPGDQKIIYASTHATSSECPPRADFSKGYVWKVYNSFDLYIANSDGSNPEPFLASPGYDAEATISPKRDKIVFTSMRDGDLDIYTVNIDGSDLKRLTTEIGYDGGPFFSWDGSKIVYRSYHPKTDEEIKRYKDFLSEELIEPNAFQIWVMDADGNNKHQVTDNEFANFAPFYHPDNNRILFCSNLNSVDRRKPDFNIWMINEDGTGLEQITFFDNFDGFPMITHDGKKLVFASNRFNRNPRDTNVFIADWVE
ncbi:MAG: TolB family protein [Calditrichaceae bacterium]